MVTEPHRRRILRLVWDEEMAAGDIAAEFDITFGAVSQHLAILRRSGYVDVRVDGNRRLYLANPEGLGALRPILEAMWSEALDDLADVIEEQQPR